jgi:nucleoside-diphosphate-sugar epimerase
VNLAALTSVNECTLNPNKTYAINVKGFKNILNSMKKFKKDKIIYASSSAVYGENRFKNTEKTKLNPKSFYGKTKIENEKIALEFFKKYKISSIGIRFSNIYGPGQLNFTAIIPDAIVSCIKNTKLTLRGNGETIRDFIHVDDIVDVYKLLAENLYLFPKKYSGEVFNAGTNSPKKIKDVVKAIYYYKNKYTEFKKTIKNIKKNKTTGEISVQFMDFKRLHKYFKWKPKRKFEKTLPSLFKWYVSYLKKDNQ